MNKLSTARFRQMLCHAAAAAVLTACQSSGDVIEALNAATGLTWVAEREPLAFARTEMRFSRSARDYVYLGPVEINNRGTREFYLWIGIATTLDRGFLAAESTDVPDRLRLRLQGEPIELKLEPWAERVPGMAAVPVYRPPVTEVQALAARVTLDQLRRFSEEGLASIEIADAEGNSREFLLWSEQSSWQAFLARAVGP